MKQKGRAQIQAALDEELDEIDELIDYCESALGYEDDELHKPQVKVKVHKPKDSNL